MQFPTQRQEFGDLIPTPENGTAALTNPPGFAWLPINNIHTYRIRIRPEGSDEPVVEETIEDNLFVPKKTLQPGTYEWTVEALDGTDTVIATREPYTVTVPPDVLRQPYPDIAALLDGVPDERPRIIFTPDRLQAIRGQLDGARKDDWRRLQHAAADAIEMGIPEPPKYGDIEDRIILKNESVKYARYCRPYIIYAQHALAMAYLFSGDERYAEEGKKRFFSIGQWAAEGPASLVSGHQDAPGMALSYGMHHIYDWLYDTMSDEEKERGGQICLKIARDNWERVGIQGNFHRRPGASHTGRMIAYIGEQALALHDLAPRDEAEKWLDFSLRAFMTIFPHWGGPDGGWNEGISYGTSYNLIYLPWVESLRAVSDIDLWQRPFFGRVRKFFMHCYTPNNEMRPFGDGADPRQAKKRRDENIHALIRHHARRFEDPVAEWWAGHISADYQRPEHSFLPRWIAAKKVEPQPPEDGRLASVFRGIGWCAMHSDFSDFEDNVFVLFKSSPYGAVSHQHGDNNAFYLSVDNTAMAIPSGYYGPFCSAPHHDLWTRQTKAQNAILVNGEGQVIRDHRAAGHIADFEHRAQISYVCGDATDAYMGKLEQWKRHIFFIRPGLVVIVDDLEAPEPATYQWLLHALEEMDTDEDAQSIGLVREGARMDVELFSTLDAPLDFSQTDEFDTPYAAGQPEEYEETRPNQWHFTAATPEKTKRMRFAAVISAGKQERIPDIQTTVSDGTLTATIQADGGEGSVIVPLSPDADSAGTARWSGDEDEQVEK
ncbi:MAG: heparinase II/III family protein [Armatimonadota bacterium]